MITATDSFSKVHLDSYSAMLTKDGWLLDRYRNEGRSFSTEEPGSAYNSGRYPEFLSVQQLRGLISEQVEPQFQPA